MFHGTAEFHRTQLKNTAFMEDGLGECLELSGMKKSHNEELLHFSSHQCVHIGKDELDVASRIHSKSEKCVQIFGQKKAVSIYKMSIPLEDLCIGQRLLKLT
jgi:hypothetical protein